MVFRPRGNTKDFWNTIKGISISEIQREANRPISLAIVGNSEQRDEIRAALYAGSRQLTQPISIPEPAFVQEYEDTSEAAGFPRDAGVFDLVLDTGGGRVDPPEGARIYAFHELGGWEPTLTRLLDDRPDLALPLARSFPAFRKMVAERIIATTATVNAEFALVTGITAAFPILSFLLPVNGLSDILMLTKNQMMMTLRLAAAYGLDIDYKHRLKEIAPILVNAFGWRALARELVGMVPFVGFLARAGIAYAGTVTVGKAAQTYYETGENISREQLTRWYKDALTASKERIRSLASGMKRQSSAPAALAPGDESMAIDTDLFDRPALPSPETPEPVL